MKSIKKWFKTNQKILVFVTKVYVVWQLAIGFLIVLGQKLVPSSLKYLYTQKNNQFIWLWPRANFDGIHYLDIARKGYGIYQQAFFPLYPRLIEFLTPFFGNQGLLAGVFLSWFFLFLALLVFYKLIKLDWEDKVAKRALVYLLIFPTAFFLASVYTESLFLFLVLGTFYFARTKRWWWAGLLGALSSATRVVGVFLLPALLVELYRQQKDQNKELINPDFLKKALPLFLIPLGLLAYMSFLQNHYQDPWLFTKVQPYFGAGRSVDKIILLYQVFWRYLKMLLTVDFFTPTYFVVVLEALSAVSFFVLLIFTFLRRWDAYLTFMVLAYLLPTLSGTFSSLPRYVLVLFPGFILLALWGEKYRWVRIMYPVVMIPLLIVSLFLFTRGYWVA